MQRNLNHLIQPGDYLCETCINKARYIEKKNSKSNYLSNTLTIEIDEHEKTSDAVPVEMDINMDADKHENTSDNNARIYITFMPIFYSTGIIM